MNEDTSKQTTDKENVKELRLLVRDILKEHAAVEKEKAEPAYKAELLEEKRKREHLERRVNELVEENEKNKGRAEQTERFAAIKTELQRNGVAKIDLAFKAIKDDVTRSADGGLVVPSPDGEVALSEFVVKFVQQNPELIPARVAGGSGVAASPKGSMPGSILHTEIDRIKPGMDPADLAKMREEIARVAMQALSGK